MPVHLFQTPAQLALTFGIELSVRFGKLCVRPLVENERRFAMQPIGRSIGRYVAPVAPNRAYFHTAESLPDVLAVANVAIGNDNRTACIDDTSGNRRPLLINPGADPT
jgi:hypothetical protein